MIIIITRMKGEVKTGKPVNITLYLDMFFLVNALMDLLLLNLMKHVLKLPGSGLKMVIAAAAGAACTSILLLIQFWTLAKLQMPGLGMKLIWIVIGDGGIPVLMLVTAFGRVPPSLLARRLAVLWLAGAGLGGLLAAAEQPGISGWYLSETMVADQWRLLPLLCWAAGIYFLLRVLQERVSRWRQEREIFCQVTLFYRGRSQTVTALWDTGNHLYEPYGHQPVHVITDEACRRLCDTVSQVAYIPYQAVGTGYGLLPGIRIDSMDVVRHGQPPKHYERPWLAVSKGALSAGRRYEMLLHGEKLE